MSKDQVIGILLLVVSIIGILIYGWIVFFTEWFLLLLQITGFIAVAGVFGILGWIGYTLATTPPPKPIEEIEKELEQELKEIEEESSKRNDEKVESEEQGK